MPTEKKIENDARVEQDTPTSYKWGLIIRNFQKFFFGKKCWVTQKICYFTLNRLKEIQQNLAFVKNHQSVEFDNKNLANLVNFGKIQKYC